MFPRQIQSQLAKKTSSAAVSRNGESITNTLCQNLNTRFQLQQVRFKRDRAPVNVNQQRVVGQLSVMSANRKQPKLLRLSNEDYVKHLTIRKAWSIERAQKKKANEEQLMKQYESIALANEELKNLGGEITEKLYAEANVREHGKRFPLEMRVPTQNPPRSAWFYDYTPIVYKKQVK